MQPLAGLVVADLTQNIAGPFCTQILGDSGADVIKIERPGRGDDSSSRAPPYWGDESAAFLNVNRNKRSLALDLKQTASREIVERLLKRSDIFIQSLGPGGAEALGLSEPSVRGLNDKLIYCSVTGFGTEGPLRNEPGYDPLMQAFSGLISVNGHPNGPPARIGTSIVDLGTGMWMVIGILCALQQRMSTGLGSAVTGSLFETSLVWASYHLMSYLGFWKKPHHPPWTSIRPVSGSLCSFSVSGRMNPSARSQNKMS